MVWFTYLAFAFRQKKNSWKCRHIFFLLTRIFCRYMIGPLLNYEYGVAAWNWIKLGENVWNQQMEFGSNTIRHRIVGRETEGTGQSVKCWQILLRLWPDPQWRMRIASIWGRNTLSWLNKSNSSRYIWLSLGFWWRNKPCANLFPFFCGDSFSVMSPDVGSGCRRFASLPAPSRALAIVSCWAHDRPSVLVRVERTGDEVPGRRRVMDRWMTDAYFPVAPLSLSLSDDQ